MVTIVYKDPTSGNSLVTAGAILWVIKSARSREWKKGGFLKITSRSASLRVSNPKCLQHLLSRVTSASA